MNAKLASIRDQVFFWRVDSLSRRILESIFTVGALTIMVKALAFAKELVAANRFGTSAEMDAFTSAFTLWTFFIALIAGALPDALLPIYSKVRRQGRAVADQLMVNAVWIYLIKLFLVTLVAALLGPWLVPIYTSNFSPEKQALAIRFFYILSPFSLLWGSSLLVTNLLQAHKRFALAASAPIIVPACAMIFMLLGRDLGIYSLMIGTILGALVQLLLISFVFFRRFCTVSLLQVRNIFTPEMMLVLRTSSPYLISGLLMGATSLIDYGMAAWLDEGSVAVLGYGLKLTTIFLALAVTATSEAFFPFLADLVAEENWQKLRLTTVRFSALILGVSLPAVLILWFFSTPLVRLIFEHGAFTPADTERVAHLLSWLGLQIPFHLLAVFASRIVCALLASRFMLFTTIINLMINIIGNLCLVRILGLQGIALSTVLVYFVSMLMTYGFLHFELKKRQFQTENS